MDTTIAASIINGSQQITSTIIRDLIQNHTEKKNRMKALYERYKASISGVPVFSREFEDKNKINNKLNNDFFSEIIDIKVGYFAGKPIAYNLDKNMYKANDKVDEAKYDKHLSVISNFNIRNNIEDIDSETAKKAAICGYGARLLYIDKLGKEKVMELDPWEVIFVYDGAINELQCAIRYYTVYVNEEGVSVPRIKVEWYDDKHITFYLENQEGEYELDNTEEVNPKIHLFDDIPVICFPNNDELQGDAEKVLSLIDAYDRTFSDVNSEIEQFRLAYMAFYGEEPDETTIERAKRTGAFGLDPGSKVEFITKSLNDTTIEHHLDRLNDNILRFSKTVNFNDEAFGGNVTGIAMKFKMFGLESKCITSERKYTAALREQYRILATAWAKKGFDIDYTNIFFTFKRNFPLNLADEADTTSKLKGNISEHTRLGLLSFVDDVEYEMDLMSQENEDMVNLDNVDLEDNTNDQAAENRVEAI